MKKNKILLIGNTVSKSAQRLRETADENGYVLDFLSTTKIKSKNGELIIPDNLLPRDFFDYDCYFFRGLGRCPEKNEMYHQLAQMLAGKGKRVVEKLLVNGVLPEDSVVPVSKRGLYKVPATRIVERADIDTLDVAYPVVAKKFGLSMGKGVQKVHSKEELITFVGEESKFLLQEFFDFDFDTRVLVIDNKVVGGLNRYRPDGEPFLTTRNGGVREAATLTPAQRKAVLEAVRTKGLEIAGVDFFMKGDEVYIIEVNESPQFNVFSKFTGINAAACVLAYLAHV